MTTNSLPSKFESVGEYEKFMYMGGLPKNRMYISPDQISGAPDYVRDFYRTLISGSEWRDSGNKFFVGGEVMRSIVYNSVCMLRSSKQSNAHVLTRTALMGIADLQHDKKIRSASGFCNKSNLTDIIKSEGLLGIVDYVDSPVSPQMDSEHEYTYADRAIIDDFLEYRRRMGFPTLIHCAYPVHSLEKVLSQMNLELLRNYYSHYNMNGKTL